MSVQEHRRQHPSAGDLARGDGARALPAQTIGGLLLERLGETLSASEEVVALAKEPLWRERMALRYTGESIDDAVRAAQNNYGLLTALRTGGHFVFASVADVLPAPVDSFVEPARGELPPLPFSRLWLEVWDSGGALMRIVDLDGRHSLMLGFGVIEDVPSQKWTIYAPMLDQQRLREIVEGVEPRPSWLDDVMPPRWVLERCLAVRSWEIRVENGRVVLGIGIGEDFREQLDALPGRWGEWWERLYAGLPEIMVHLIHLSGGTTTPISVPRSRRREHIRRFGQPYPSLYWVYLGASTEGHPSQGERNFYHRWLVRGHYRRDSRGRHLVPGKGMCVWVRPYIKGPDGAPWKGRPLHISGKVA